MANRRTVDLLPEIFRTDTNRKFLGSTFDQMVQEPNLRRTQGYVGRKIGPGVVPSDNYVIEQTATRNNYQLEPGVVFLKPDSDLADDAITFPGIIDALKMQGADTTRLDRLTESEYYTWDSFCDLDKFTNYSQYYWLPNGPSSVDVAGSVVPLTDSFSVTRTNVYTFGGLGGNNPVITLVRGGNYTFEVNQPGHSFWIQSAPGAAGVLPASPNISSRNVLGVVNNGEDSGTISFNVPSKIAQDFYYSLENIGTVDLVTDLKFTDFNNIFVSEFFNKNPNGVDGITDLDGRTIVFANQETDLDLGGWIKTTRFDPLTRTQPSTQPDPLNGAAGSFDSIAFDQADYIEDIDTRYSIWQIRYVNDESGNPFIQLNSIRLVSKLSKFSIIFGSTYSNTQWYRNAEGFFEQIPLLTAIQDTLWYQDSSDPEIFGRIRLVEEEDSQTINIDDIVGATNYVSPNGIAFSNGLKIQFRGSVNPSEFRDREFYVEGVGTGPGVEDRVGFVDGEAYFGNFHFVNGKKVTGLPGSENFQQYIYDTVQESLDNIGSGETADAPFANRGISGSSQGNGIKLIPVQNLVTPETYTKSASIPYDSTAYDAEPYDSGLNSPRDPDYITINRASQSNNAWSRSNRWFHIDVIRQSAEYNNQVVTVDNDRKAKRPIIEFRANLKLFNYGTQGKQPVDIIDFAETDAFTNINGSLGYSIDGYNLINGTRIVFANDSSLETRNKIWQVEFIDPDQSGSQVINLVPAQDFDILTEQIIVCLSGNTLQGKSYWFDGVEYHLAQEKKSTNQPPLFDVFDPNGFSYSDISVYPSSTFKGTRLFGYAEGRSQNVDSVLGFPLRYLNLNNVGDIVFENYLYSDKFVFVENSAGQTKHISEGFLKEYFYKTGFTDRTGWQKAASKNRSSQVFRFSFSPGTVLVLDVSVDESSTVAPLQIFVDGSFVNPSQYLYEVAENTTQITLLETYPNNAIVEVHAISNQKSQVAFYQVPINLENNPLNQNSDSFTLGTIRTHYESIGQNLRTITGDIIGANNTRDLGNILEYGDIIVQHSSPMMLTGAFLRQSFMDVFSSIQYNSNEYSKYKAVLLETAAELNYFDQTPGNLLDEIVLKIASTKSEMSPFYWSDMLPSGETYIENKYIVGLITTSTFDVTQVYDFSRSNFNSLLIYQNGNLLTKGYDYEVGVDTPTVTITADLAVGDEILIREYLSTVGNFVPNTPTKLGLYPSYRPEIFVDNTYVNPRRVIRGHDGSITAAFGDIRDEILLEFETRIFNNLKISSDIPLLLTDVLPGQFRTTDYSLAEINRILSTDFLRWAGWNRVNYTEQTYISDNPFTYNYSQSSNRLTKDLVPVAAWRGLYNHFYDTYYPDTRPWEMLGLSQKPSWWESFYGPAPYTSGNTVLWDDLAEGFIRDPQHPRKDPRYARPRLLEVLPVDSEGQLLDPLGSVVGNYDATSFKRSWTFGDIAPTEYAWRSSSAWPFAVMRLLALTKPAEFFSLFADRDRYVYNDDIEQYLWDNRYRLDATKLNPLYGNDNSKASYINWIIDYNRRRGIDGTENLTRILSNLDIRLCWRTGSFTDKKYLKILTERSAPDSLNASLTLPDESYKLLLHKNQPEIRIAYSSVIVQKTEKGWSLSGYDQENPFFEILVSRPGGRKITVESSDTVIRISLDHTDNIIKVPYGFEFTSRDAVCDFLVSYGTLLIRRGIKFEQRENGYQLTWLQMAQEFLNWSQQGWVTGSIINLNPAAEVFEIERTNEIADDIYKYGFQNTILDQNKKILTKNDVLIDRLDNLLRITSRSEGNTVNFVNLQFISYEHLVIFDNRSIFSDLIYQPVTGSRQSRVLVSGWLSNEWNGTLNVPGFILNQDNIKEWVPNKKYVKGEIVLFKNEYWTASEIIQPSQEFNYNLWFKSDYDQIQQGLLPNAATQSVELRNAYNINSANIDREIDLFSYGLIGFRPREYMQSLNLDDISQVNLYQQFLRNKGTVLSAEMFSLSDQSKETTEYDVYEYWSLLRSQYGATANRNYVELLLDQALLPSNPGLIQVTLPQQQSLADQQILLENVWKTSEKLSSTDIFQTKKNKTTDISLPTAGYVSLDDVDLTAFDFESLENQDESVSDIRVGSEIWIAKVNSHDWGIFRAKLVPGEIVNVSDNLQGNSLVEFTAAHDLSTGDILAIKFFDTAIDGIYRVLAVPSIFSVIIAYQFRSTQTSIDGNGVGFTLQSARVKQASDIVDIDYAKQLYPGVKIWVDNNGKNQWEVLEKVDPYTTIRTIPVKDPVEFSRYGSAISQGLENLTAFVGAPGYNPNRSTLAPGAVYAYVKTQDDVYEQDSILTLQTLDTVGYGSAIDVGRQDWAVIGASESYRKHGYASVIYREPGSEIIEQRQLLTVDPAAAASDAEEFGFSVTVSLDERWMYVGAPGGNRVYTYQRVERQSQSKIIQVSEVQNLYNYSNSIVIDNDSQLFVAVNNVEQTLGVDYILTANDVVFSNPPTLGSILNFARRSTEVFIGGDSTISFDVSRIYGVSDTASITVRIDDVLQRPFIDYDIDTGNDLVFYATPPDGSRIIVTAETYFAPAGYLSIESTTGKERFGSSVTTTTSGRKIMVGAPGVDFVDPNTQEIIENAGAFYVFDRAVESFIVTDVTQRSYTTVENLQYSTNVSLNGKYLINNDGNINGDFSIVGNTITLNDDIELTVGDIITVDINRFVLEQTFMPETPGNNFQMGFHVDQCVNDCSLYIGSPYADLEGEILEAGQVELFTNQARVYGIVTGRKSNPILTPGDYIRINNFYVRVPGTTVEELVEEINNSNIPNVAARLTPSLHLSGDAVTRKFSVGTIYSSLSSYRTKVYVNGELKIAGVDYSYNPEEQTIMFVSAPVFGADIEVVSGRIIITVKNFNTSSPLNRIQVDAATGTVFDDLGLVTYIKEQTITAPNPQNFAHFGENFFISDDTTTLLVGAPGASATTFVTLDNAGTTFDSGSIIFTDRVDSSGVIYSYNRLPAVEVSFDNPDQFVFGQQIIDQNISSGERFGTAVDFTTGTLLVGAPNSNIGDSTLADYGRAVSFRNTESKPAWQIIRREEPVVDISLLNTVFLYDRATNLPSQYLDYFDPMQGRILGVVSQNIDYIGAIDPAAYNIGEQNNRGNVWRQDRVGQVWWDTSNVRFIDPNQNDLVYASRRWGEIFPGSSVDVYQWISSDVPPAEYEGPGTPYSQDSYVLLTSLNQQGIFVTEYFFWVTGLNTVIRDARKSLSIETIKRYIESPRSSGISYLAPISSSTVAIYNSSEFLSARDTVLHIEYDKTLNDNNIHTEYQLVADGRADGFLSDALYKKFQDSMCGSDQVGNPVPDPFLPPSEKYGIEVRPRQSMFVNRFAALQNYLERANQILKQYPIAESKKMSLLNSEESEPSPFSNAWDKRLENIEELSFQNLALVPVGYRYLVASDTSYNGIWTIYEVESDVRPGSKKLSLIRVQNYDTKLFWNYIDWYRPGYNPKTQIVAEVPTYSSLETISVAEGSSVKVTANARGLFEIYQLQDSSWIRVGLEKGTIEFSRQLWDYTLGRYGFDSDVFDTQFYDQAPVVETRKIIQAINEELMVDDLSLERNQLLILIFNYILSEQIAPEWLFKTSLIDVDHTIRELLPFQTYRRDNQDFVLNYIQEVKPYHTQIREFNLIYNGQDIYEGTVSDFDVPAFWSTDRSKFISPILDNTGTLSQDSGFSDSSEIWQTTPWDQWYSNYLLSVESVAVVNRGTGYTIPPEITVVGDAEVPARLEAKLNSAGQIFRIEVLDSGSGYSTTPEIVISGGNGFGASAIPVMGNNLVRNMVTTIKYDRFNYNSSVVEWKSATNYSAGTLVRFDNRVWRANNSSQSIDFDPSQWTLVPADLLSGVDRTMGYYVPRADQPGLDLSLLISGIDYPGVQVKSPGFDSNTGFDVGNFDINPFDNISFGAEGTPTYDPGILDAIYESSFGDTYIGTRVTDINVDGGQFVDTFSSHAPEELVPGAIFDTLDIKVFTTPGSDWSNNGHGFPSGSVRYICNTVLSSYSFENLVEYPVAVQVWNQSRGVRLYPDVNYRVNWIDKTIEIIDPDCLNVDEVITVSAYAIGGGNQLFTSAYNSSDVAFFINTEVNFELAKFAVIFVNGVEYVDYSMSRTENGLTRINLLDFIEPNSLITITVMGQTGVVPEYSWSIPVSQYFVYDGLSNTFELTNTLSGTNPANIVVEKNGVRARPAEGIEYISDGTTVQYLLPINGNYNQDLIADNDVAVYVDNRPLTLTVDFEVLPSADSSFRSIMLTDAPVEGSRILISVRTAAQYILTGNSLIWKSSGGLALVPGDIISVTTWNDTREQDLLTLVFVGPTSEGTTIDEGYDENSYDEADQSFQSGSFDYSTGAVILNNKFNVGRAITDSSRMLVSLDGLYLAENEDYIVNNGIVEIKGAPINAAQVVAITLYTDSIVPGKLAFRLFQDMRGQQMTYRITDSSTAVLTQALSATDDIIFVDDVSKLSDPNLEQGILGLLIVDGERITYRTKNIENNTVSGLRRGTAGTGAADHDLGSFVYNVGLANLLPMQYQDRTVHENFLGNGTQTVYQTENIQLASTEYTNAVEVFVGGIKQIGNYVVTSVNPVSVAFSTAPAENYQVTIAVRQGQSWYVDNGVALQKQNTFAARFIRGE